MNSTSSSVDQGTPSLRLSVRGLGNVPAFKNSKNIVRNKKTGVYFLVSDKKLKARMDAITASFVSQLRCAFATASAGTSTDAPRQSLTASLPHDDNWLVVPEMVVRAELVTRGNEGADVVVERIA